MKNAMKAPQAAEPQLAYTVSRGPLANRRGQSVQLGRRPRPSPIISLARRRESNVGGDYTLRWLGASGIILTLEYHDEGRHSVPARETGLALERAADEKRLAGNLFYSTPRGARVIFEAPSARGNPGWLAARPRFQVHYTPTYSS